MSNQRGSRGPYQPTPPGVGYHSRLQLRGDTSYGFDHRNRHSQPPLPHDYYNQFPNDFYNLGPTTYDHEINLTRRDLSWEHEFGGPHSRRRGLRSPNNPPHNHQGMSKSRYNQNTSKTSHSDSSQSSFQSNNSSHPTSVDSNKPSETNPPPSTKPKNYSAKNNRTEPQRKDEPAEGSLERPSSPSHHEGTKTPGETVGLPPAPSNPMAGLNKLLEQQAQSQRDIQNYLSQYDLANNSEVKDYISRYDHKTSNKTQTCYGDSKLSDPSHRNSTPGSGSDSESNSSFGSISSARDEEKLPKKAAQQIRNIVESCFRDSLANLGLVDNTESAPRENSKRTENRESTGCHSGSSNIRSTPKLHHDPNHAKGKVDFRDTFTTYGNDNVYRARNRNPHCSTPAVPPSNLPSLDPDLLSHVIFDALRDHLQQDPRTTSNNDLRQDNRSRRDGPDYHNTEPNQTDRHDTRSRRDRPDYQNLGAERTDRSRQFPPQSPPTNYYPTRHYNSHDTTRPQMITTFSDAGLEKFSGRAKDYSNFKDLFKIVTEGYPEKYKLLKLRQFLDYNSNAEIAYIHADDEGALEQAWKELDELHGQGLGNAEYHVSQVMSVMTWRPCRNENDLERLYTHLKTHLAMARRAGDQYTQQTEGLAHFMSNILYGWCQDKVIELKLNKPAEFCMDKIMSYIKRAVQHDRQKSRETKYAVGHRQPRPYFQKWHDQSYSRDKNYGDDRRSKNYYKKSDESQNHHFKYDLSQRQSRSPHRSNDSRPRRERSNSSHRSGYSSSQEAATFNINGVETSSVLRKPRSNSPHPRGSRAKSPSRSPSIGRQHFRCLFCKDNEHLSMHCTKISSENALNTARAEHLCFICLTGGHRPFYCPANTSCGNPLCKDSGEPKHGKLLCQAFQKKH